MFLHLLGISDGINKFLCGAISEEKLSKNLVKVENTRNSKPPIILVTLLYNYVLERCFVEK